MSGPKLDNRRMLAALIDLAVVGAGAAVILVAAGSGLGAGLAAVVIGWGLYYYFACESGGGQTLGKKLMNLRVVRVDGSDAGMREVAVRTVLRVVDTVLVGLVSMLVTGERRARVGDLAAGTMIVSSERTPTVAPAAAVAAPEAPVPVVEEERFAEDLAAERFSMEEPAAEDEVVVEDDYVMDDEPVDMDDEPVDKDDEPVVVDDEPVVADEPVAEDEPAVVDEPVAMDEPVAEDEVAVADEPVAEDEPVVGDEPAAPGPAPAVEASAVPELRPFPPVAEEEDSYGEEPATGGPVQLSVVEAPPVVEVGPEEPVAAEPVEVERLDIATPSLKELAGDVAVAKEQREPELEPVVEEDPVAEAEPVDAEVAEDDAPVTILPVETVSAIDLVMGEEEPADDQQAG